MTKKNFDSLLTVLCFGAAAALFVFLVWNTKLERSALEHGEVDQDARWQSAKKADGGIHRAYIETDAGGVSIACSETMQAWIAAELILPEPLPPGSEASMTARILFDRQSPQVYQVNPFPSARYGGPQSVRLQAEPRSFVAALADRKRFSFSYRVQPDKPARTVTFQLTGSKAEISRAAGACGISGFLPSGKPKPERKPSINRWKLRTFSDQFDSYQYAQTSGRLIAGGDWLSAKNKTSQLSVSCADGSWRAVNLHYGYLNLTTVEHFKTGWSRGSVRVAFEPGGQDTMSFQQQWGGTQVIAVHIPWLVGKLERANTMTVRLPQYGSAETHQYDVRGFRETAAALRKRCGIG